MAKPVEHVRKLIEVLEEGGWEVRPYSGRGMFGKQCVSAVSC